MTKILVIDDDEDLRERLKRLLELNDYQIYTAEDGQKGLEIFDKESPQIALVDIRMPGIDGIEVLKKIKQKSEETEVIIITGHGAIASAIEAVREGAFSYIQKPIEYERLSIDIKSALKKQEMRRKLDEYVHNLEQEITQRKQVERTLKESEQYYRSLLSNLHEDILVIDRDYRITDANNTFLVTTGHKLDEVIGRHCYEVTHGYNEPCSGHGEDCPLREGFTTGEASRCHHEHTGVDGSKVFSAYV